MILFMLHCIRMGMSNKHQSQSVAQVTLRKVGMNDNPSTYSLTTLCVLILYTFSLYVHRYGTTTSCSGMRQTMAELVCLGCHQTKCGSLTLCCLISKCPSSLCSSNRARDYTFRPLQCRWQLRGTIQVKRAHLSRWRGAMGPTCYLSGEKIDLGGSYHRPDYMFSCVFHTFSAKCERVRVCA